MNYDIKNIVEQQRKKGLLLRLDINRLKEIIKEFESKNLNIFQIVFLNGVVLEVIK